jgi:hypothetical protein
MPAMESRTGHRGRKWSGKSLMVTLSKPGLPLLAFTLFQAALTFSVDKYHIYYHVVKGFTFRHYIGSRVTIRLPSDGSSRFRPCLWLVFMSVLVPDRIHIQGTFTP